MRFFRKAAEPKDWLALVVRSDGIAAASVRFRDEHKPLLTVAAFFAGETRAEAIERAARALSCEKYLCSTVLASDEYRFLSLEAPNVLHAELKSAMRWRLKDIVDIPVEHMTYDVLDIPLDPAAAARTQQSVFAVAAADKLIEARQKQFAHARIPLRAIDVPEMAQRNLSVLAEPEGRGIAMLSFGPRDGLLTVTWRGELYLARRLEIGLDQILDPDAERRYQAFERIALELQRSLDNFDRQYAFVNVVRLVLAAPAVDGLEAYLAGNLYTRIESLDLGQLLDLAEGVELGDAAAQERLLFALGAALRVEEAAA